MDSEQFNASVVGAAAAQFNARLQAVAEGQEQDVVRREGEPDSGRVQLTDARPFLLSGLDVDLEAIDALANGSVRNVFADVAAHGGELRAEELAALFVSMFATGVLHERELRRRAEEAVAA